MSFYIPKGFLFSTAEAAIKKPGRNDLALIYSNSDCVMSGMFTTNKIKAAPVKLDMRKIKKGSGRAIIINSGNANACTGEQGMKDAAEMSEIAGNLLRINQDLVYVCSTGVIGTPLPMERIRSKIPSLVASLGNSSIEDVAASIMTTDTFPKIVTKKVRILNKDIIISGICKGAGMICPNMATMLSFLMTDVNIEKQALDTALKTAVGRSFNRITIDGDMSTNDTTLIMANALSGNPIIKAASKAFMIFSSALAEIAYELSSLIVKDAEGASKLVEIEVVNAKNDKDAEKAAFSIANSLLVKTAIYGNDANWGRFMAALGYSGISLKENKTDIYLNKLKIVKNGLGTGKDNEANESLKDKYIRIQINLNIGKGSAKVLTCDLTEGYIKINAEYRT